LILTQEDMLRRILETKAVSIWNHKTGPIFWYAASIPGPFYVNTELVLGKDLSSPLLEEITAIITDIKEPQARSEKLEVLIMKAYESNSFFQSIIETMEAQIREAFPKGSFSVLSGGERRDWPFSIPLAKKLGIKHAYLFKNGEHYCAKPLQKGEIAIHVSDLINNAASYFNAWLPILEKNGLSCIGTLCVNSRGSNGVDRLKKNGQKVITLNSVDVSFFESCCEKGLIDQATLDELRIFFEAPKKWAAAYLMGKTELFNAQGIDAKSFDRLCTFFKNDPWELRPAHEAFFLEIEKAIGARQAT